jgi:hypothetical protein
MAELTDRQRDAIKQQLTVELEIAKFLAFSILAVAGGSFGVILGGTSWLRFGLGIGGLVITNVGIMVLRDTYRTIRKLLATLKEDI